MSGRVEKAREVELGRHLVDDVGGVQTGLGVGSLAGEGGRGVGELIGVKVAFASGVAVGTMVAAVGARVGATWTSGALVGVGEKLGERAQPIKVLPSVATTKMEKATDRNRTGRFQPTSGGRSSIAVILLNPKSRLGCRLDPLPHPLDHLRQAK